MVEVLKDKKIFFLFYSKHVRPLVEDDSKIVGGQNADPGQFPYQVCG